MVLLSETWVDSKGIAGDRYALGSGHWSDWPDRTGIALTIIESEILSEIGLDPIAARRNVVSYGISLDQLVGKRFLIGEVECFGVRPCLPCRYLEDMTRPGLRRELEGIRGGLRADVLNAGAIRLNDSIELIG